MAGCAAPFANQKSNNLFLHSATINEIELFLLNWRKSCWFCWRCKFSAANNSALIPFGLFALGPAALNKPKQTILPIRKRRMELFLVLLLGPACRQHSYSIYHSIQKLKVFSFHEHATAILTSNYCYNIFLFNLIQFTNKRIEFNQIKIKFILFLLIDEMRELVNCLLPPS